MKGEDGKVASLVEELTEVLEQEYKIYRDLLPIAESKTKVIIKNDLEALQNITEQEHQVIDQINALETKRAQVIFNIGTVLNQKPEELTLSKVIDLLTQQPKEQEKLNEVHKSLKQIIQRLTEVNYQNQSLIEESLEMIEFNMNLIQSTRMSPGNNYTKGAQTIDTPVFQAGMFDAKQ